jgi:hypothetical protein
MHVNMAVHASVAEVSSLGSQVEIARVQVSTCETVAVQVDGICAAWARHAA